MLGIFSVQHKSSKTPQDDHKSNTGSNTSGTSGTVQKEKVKGQMERRLSLMSGIALIVGTMIGKSCFINNLLIRHGMRVVLRSNICTDLLLHISGSGIFVSPTGLLERTGSIHISLVVWGLCGVISMLGKREKFVFD